MLTKYKPSKSWVYFLPYMHNLLQPARKNKCWCCTKKCILKMYYLYLSLCWKSMSDGTIYPQGTLISPPTPHLGLPCVVLDKHSQLIHLFWPKHVVPEVYAYLFRNYSIWALKPVCVKWNQITCFLVDEIALCRVKKKKWLQLCNLLGAIF